MSAIPELPAGPLGDRQWEFDSPIRGAYVYAHDHGEDANTIGVIGANGLTWDHARDLADTLLAAVDQLEDELRADLEHGLLTPTEVAERLAVTVPHARTLIRTGGLHGINVGSLGAPQWRVRKSELLAFIERRTEA